MQVNLNNQANKPQFGMAIHSNANVNKLLKAKIKNAAELDKLNKIIEQQNKNDLVDITLLSDDKYLTANVYPRDITNEEFQNLGRQFTENAFTRMFGGIVGFLKKAADYADKTASQIAKRNAMNIDKILNKMDNNKEVTVGLHHSIDKK